MYNAYGTTARLGGIFFLDKRAWEKSNGFSNNYWGWGAEDNDFIWRIRQEADKKLKDPLILDNSDVKAGIATRRAKSSGKSPSIEGIYVPKNSTNFNKGEFNTNASLWNKNQPEYTRNKSYRYEGLNTCKYKVQRKLKTKYGYRLIIEV